MSEMVKVELDNGETATVSREFADRKELTVVEADAPKKTAPGVPPPDPTEKVRVRLENGAEATVGAGFAKSRGLTVLDKKAVNRFGVALRDKPAVDLRGKELEQALKNAGLPTTGSAAEKRERLADHLAGPETDGTVPTGDNTEGVSS